MYCLFVCMIIYMYSTCNMYNVRIIIVWLSLSLLYSVLVSHFKCEAHADVQYNELVLLSCDGAIEEVEAVAQGGVLAGNVKFLDTQAKGKQ